MMHLPRCYICHRRHSLYRLCYHQRTFRSSTWCRKMSPRMICYQGRMMCNLRSPPNCTCPPRKLDNRSFRRWNTFQLDIFQHPFCRSWASFQPALPCKKMPHRHHYTDPHRCIVCKQCHHQSSLELRKLSIRYYLSWYMPMRCRTRFRRLSR